jgi:hypothetical protein
VNQADPLEVAMRGLAEHEYNNSLDVERAVAMGARRQRRRREAGTAGGLCAVALCIVAGTAILRTTATAGELPTDIPAATRPGADTTTPSSPSACNDSPTCAHQSPSLAAVFGTAGQDCDAQTRQALKSRVVLSCAVAVKTRHQVRVNYSLFDSHAAGATYYASSMGAAPSVVDGPVPYQQWTVVRSDAPQTKVAVLFRGSTYGFTVYDPDRTTALEAAQSISSAVTLPTR